MIPATNPLDSNKKDFIAFIKPGSVSIVMLFKDNL